ncbi:TetR family transcriptional regulator [Nocardia sp. ET3-3]|uniref:TetR family transcriptional regulator n=1 Tax=Nocardia terrae TaxID=2675851 RepID=A0A7K1V2A7_9NOCA|nr:TetR family transcriptional regulator [Nocardia terrae]
MADEHELGLRDRKKIDTRQALSDAAWTLLAERGVENLRRDEIAARVGVSVRTFNNYFTTKYDALAYRQVERLQHNVATLRARPADESLWDAITVAFVESADTGTQPSPARQTVLRDLMNRPAMRTAVSKVCFTNDELIDVIAARTGTDPARDVYPRLVAAAVGAAWQSTAEVFLQADSPVSSHSLLRSAFQQIRAGLPDPSVQNR